jgi:uncharacterized protein HemY
VAQDHPPSNTIILPFQTNAADNTDEQIALQFFQDKEYAKAAEVYERLYGQKPSYNLYTYYLFCLIENQDYSKADKLVKTAMKNDKDALKYLVDQGYIAFRKGEPEKAKKIYDESIRKLEPSRQQIFELANAFIVRNENEYAEKVYLKGRQLLNAPIPLDLNWRISMKEQGNLKKRWMSFLTSSNSTIRI